MVRDAFDGEDEFATTWRRWKVGSVTRVPALVSVAAPLLSRRSTAPPVEQSLLMPRATSFSDEEIPVSKEPARIRRAVEV